MEEVAGQYADASGWLRDLAEHDETFSGGRIVLVPDEGAAQRTLVSDQIAHCVEMLGRTLDLEHHAFK